MTKARSNATANAAKGDLTVGNGTNLSGVLAAGSNGDTIVADSSTATGLRYTAGNAQGNPVLNSAMQVWQRGTSIATPTSQYTADRWYAAGNSAVTVTRQSTSDTTNLPFIQYCARVQRNSGSAVTNNVNFLQSFETINSISLAGKTVTLSFYARAGANYSSASNVLRALIYTGTGTDQNAYFGYTGGANAIDQNATLTTTWQRFTYSGTIATNVTELAPYFLYTPTGTAGANDYFEVTGVQVDIGSVALPFRTYAGTIQGELAACQRYYEIGTSGYVGDARLSGIKYGAWTQYSVVKRVAPTITVTSTAQSGFNGIAVASDNYTNGFITSQNSSGVAGGTVFFFNSFTASAEL